MTTTFDLKAYMKARAAEVDEALESFLAADSPSLGPIVEAMRYSVFPGGKRFRPVLALASCEALGQPYRKAMPAACGNGPTAPDCPQGWWMPWPAHQPSSLWRGRRPAGR